MKTKWLHRVRKIFPLGSWSTCSIVAVTGRFSSIRTSRHGRWCSRGSKVNNGERRASGRAFCDPTHVCELNPGLNRILGYHLNLKAGIRRMRTHARARILARSVEILSKKTASIRVCAAEWAFQIQRWPPLAAVITARRTFCMRVTCLLYESCWPRTRAGAPESQWEMRLARAAQIVGILIAH
jgi:hypothetical protein